MDEWIFPGRRLDRYDIEDEFNALRFELCEAADVAFTLRGRNRFTFSRLFLAHETAETERSVLVNHTGGERFEMEAGHLYFLPSGIDFEYDFRATTRFLSFHFHLERYGREVFAGETLCRAARDEAGRIPQLLALLQKTPFTLRDNWELRSLLSAEIARFLSEGEGASDAERCARYSALLRFLREEAHGALSIEELAAVAGIPQQRLSREFPRDFGVTLKQYLARSVAARAEALLRNPALKVREAARLLRFRDEYYFSRFFKRETGSSPSDYRRFAQTRRQDGKGAGGIVVRNS